MRFKKLLVPVDFSDPSHAAVRAATQMCADTGAQMVLVHVWQPNVYSYRAPVFPISFAEDYVNDARKRLHEWQQEALQAGAKLVSVEVLTGTPWHELVELLGKDESFDLVVMGTHGHTGLKHVLLGSVAEKVVRHAPCPVLVFRTRS